MCLKTEMAEEESIWNPAYAIRVVPKLKFDDHPPRELTEREVIRREKLTRYVGMIENVLMNEPEKGIASLTLKPEDNDLVEELKKHLDKRNYFITVSNRHNLITITAVWEKFSSFTTEWKQSNLFFSDIVNTQ